MRGPDVYGWRAVLIEDWAMQGSRLVLFRQYGQSELEVVTGYDERGVPVMSRQEAGLASDFPGLLIPQHALDSLGGLLRPEAGGPEVRRLEEALAVERARVDQVLERRVQP